VPIAFGEAAVRQAFLPFAGPHMRLMPGHGDELSIHSTEISSALPWRRPRDRMPRGSTSQAGAGLCETARALPRALHSHFRHVPCARFVFPDHLSQAFAG